MDERKKRERDRRHYQRKKGVQGDEEEENEREGQGAAGATFDGGTSDEEILEVANGRPRNVTDDVRAQKRQEQNKRYYESKKNRVLKVKWPQVRKALFSFI